MKAFIVKSKDLFDKKKNPGLKLSVKSVMENDKIPKSEIMEERKKDGSTNSRR